MDAALIYRAHSRWLIWVAFGCAVAIQEVGVALAQTLQLLCPLGALALSTWIFHERLTSAQLISAAILLIGAFLAMRTKPAAVVETAENI